MTERERERGREIDAEKNPDDMYRAKERERGR